MRSKLILFALALFSAGAAVAQPTLTAVTSNPMNGDKFFHYTARNAAPGNAGANVTWDFTGIGLALDTSVNNRLNYVPCDSFHHCAGLSGISTADSFSAKYYYSLGSFLTQSWFYYITDGQKLALTAINEGNNPTDRTDSIFFSNPEDILRYPMTYTNTFLDTFDAKLMLSSYPAAAKDTMHIVGTQHAVADGYGLLKLPIGTYTNVLRVHRLQTVMVIDTNITVTAFDTITYNVDDYRWYNTLQREPLMVTTIRNAGGVIHDTTTYYTALPAIAAIANVPGAVSGVQLSPNPAQGNFNVTLILASAQRVFVTLTDVAGRVLQYWDNGMLGAGEHRTNYDTGALPAGLYFVRIQTPEGTVVKPLQLQ